MRHTPGPWGISDTFRIFGPNRRHPQSAELGVEMTTNTTVAWVACPNREEQDANAALIAAAPELLEAAKGLMAEFDAPVPDLTLKTLYRKKLRDAIAKAEGRS